MVHPDHNIRPFARYNELYESAASASTPRPGRQSDSPAATSSICQCWSNLAWIHPLAFELDPDLQELLAKGQHWTEKEKQLLLDKQMDLLRQVIPMHKELAESGQIELSDDAVLSSDLAAAVDKRLARQAMPEVACRATSKAIPRMRPSIFAAPSIFHTRTFGKPPRGMWPSEGSVAQAIIPAIAAAGIEWIATDEEILFLLD